MIRILCFKKKFDSELFLNLNPRPPTCYGRTAFVVVGAAEVFLICMVEATNSVATAITEGTASVPTSFLLQK